MPKESKETTEQADEQAAVLKSKRNWKIFKIAIVGTVFALVLNHALAGPEVYVGKRTAATTSLNDIDHRAWHELLQKFVDQDGMVNYAAWHGSADDVRKLDEYLALLSTGDMNKSTNDAKLAFWINAYNAVTIKGILREYPTTSIRNHTAKLIGYNIWKHLQLYVGGQPWSLEAIEHQILRRMNEPRIHFAIVCASIGCPRLLNEAYTANRLQQQLEANAKDFFRRPQNFRYEPSNKRFYVSAILNWFGTDFGTDHAAQLRSISGWLPTVAAQQAARDNSVRLSFLDYDWKLNAQ